MVSEAFGVEATGNCKIPVARFAKTVGFTAIASASDSVTRFCSFYRAEVVSLSPPDKPLQLRFFLN